MYSGIIEEPQKAGDFYLRNYLNRLLLQNLLHTMKL